MKAENTKTKRSDGLGRILKSPSRQSVSKARQKLPNLLSTQETAMFCRILENEVFEWKSLLRESFDL